MLEILRAWLNGNKEYFTGILLYEKLGSNDALKKLFKNGATDFNHKRLQEELLTICNELKSASDDNSAEDDDNNSTRIIDHKQNDKARPRPAIANQVKKEEKDPANPELYQATKLQADKLYKETMNKRAVLFALASPEDYTDANTEARINARAKLAISVVTGFQDASATYDRAEYVKEHGRLPDHGEPDDKNEYDHLQEHLVKQALDNARKNLNKMKKREQTPERIQLQQKHEANIEKLLKKWHSLKQ